MIKTFCKVLAISCLTQIAYAQSEEAIAKIDNIRLAMQEHAKNNEFAKVAEFYASDATVNGFDGSFNGIKEISAYWKGIRGQGVNWEWEKLAYSGTDEYVTQTGISLLTLKYGEMEITYSSQFSVIWEKQSDGEYKIISDFYRNYIEPK